MQIDLTDTTINFDPQTEAEEIAQNVRTILRTVHGSCPMYRDFGVSGDMVDAPMGVAAAFYRQTVVEAVRKYEPRAEVTAVSFAGSDPVSGVLMPTVTIAIAG